MWMIADAHLDAIERLLRDYGNHAVEIDATDTMQRVHAALVNIELCRHGYPGGVAKEPEIGGDGQIHSTP